MANATVIAIDGPSGSGKSSTSKGVAIKLGYAYLDTGAMYRAMTFGLMGKGVNLDDPEEIAAAAPGVTIVSGTHPERPTIEVDGKDVSEAIRTPEVTANVSKVAAVPAVREMLVESQKLAIDTAITGIVVEGRDIANVVAPNADLKVFLSADPVARAHRRALEVGETDEAAMREALDARDAIDSNRKVSPLAKAPDAIEIDGTELTLEQVIDKVIELIPAK